MRHWRKNGQGGCLLLHGLEQCFSKGPCWHLGWDASSQRCRMFVIPGLRASIAGCISCCANWKMAYVFPNVLCRGGAALGLEVIGDYGVFNLPRVLSATGEPFLIYLLFKTYSFIYLFGRLVWCIRCNIIYFCCLITNVHLPYHPLHMLPYFSSLPFQGCIFLGVEL